MNLNLGLQLGRGTPAAPSFTETLTRFAPAARLVSAAAPDPLVTYNEAMLVVSGITPPSAAKGYVFAPVNGDVDDACLCRFDSNIGQAGFTASGSAIYSTVPATSAGDRVDMVYYAGNENATLYKGECLAYRVNLGAWSVDGGPSQSAYFNGKFFSFTGPVYINYSLFGGTAQLDIYRAAVWFGQGVDPRESSVRDLFFTAGGLENPSVGNAVLGTPQHDFHSFAQFSTGSNAGSEPDYTVVGTITDVTP